MLRTHQRQRGSCGGGAFVPPVFTPQSIPGLVAWYDPSDAASVTIATGVSQMNDKSGNGFHMVQATGANQPQYQTAVAAMGGKNSLFMDFNGQFINATASGALAALQNGDNTIVIISRYTGSDTRQVLQSFLAASQKAKIEAATSSFLYQESGTGTLSVTPPSMTATHIHTMVASGANISATADGANIQGGAGRTNTAIDLLRLGNYWGYVGEATIYNRALTAAELNQLCGTYMQPKWGSVAWTAQ